MSIDIHMSKNNIIQFYINKNINKVIQSCNKLAAVCMPQDHHCEQHLTMAHSSY